MMTEVTSDQVAVRSNFMRIDGRQMLVGVGYLDKLGWYNVAVMDVDAIIDRSLFLPIGLLLAATMIVVALVIAFIFKLGVVDRLRKVEKGVVAVREDIKAPVPADTGNDEIGRLSRSFATMASSVQDNMRTLEHLVEERTAELQSLAYRDQLTGIANRRGFAEGFDGIKAAAKPNARLALLLIDIDRFKDHQRHPWPPGGRRSCDRSGAPDRHRAAADATPAVGGAATNSSCCSRILASGRCAPSPMRCGAGYPIR